jgi:hypothetical protein
MWFDRQQFPFAPVDGSDGSESGTDPYDADEEEEHPYRP